MSYSGTWHFGLGDNGGVSIALGRFTPLEEQSTNGVRTRQEAVLLVEEVGVRSFLYFEARGLDMIVYRS